MCLEHFFSMLRIDPYYSIFVKKLSQQFNLIEVLIFVWNGNKQFMHSRILKFTTVSGKRTFNLEFQEIVIIL